MIVPSEHAEQVAVIQWCDYHREARNIFAIPNGGARSPITGRKLKEEGVRPGVPDLFLPLARDGYHGLFIEMKRRKRYTTSPAQKERIEQLMRDGYRVEVCRGADEAIGVIAEYLG